MWMAALRVRVARHNAAAAGVGRAHAPLRRPHRRPVARWQSASTADTVATAAPLERAIAAMALEEGDEAPMATGGASVSGEAGRTVVAAAMGDSDGGDEEDGGIGLLNAVRAPTVASVVKEGYLMRPGRRGGARIRQWFVLTPVMMAAYRSATSVELIAAISLNGCSVDETAACVASERPSGAGALHRFVISDGTMGRCVLETCVAEDAASWVATIRKQVRAAP